MRIDVLRGSYRHPPISDGAGVIYQGIVFHVRLPDSLPRLPITIFGKCKTNFLESSNFPSLGWIGGLGPLIAGFSRAFYVAELEVEISFVRSFGSYPVPLQLVQSGEERRVLAARVESSLGVREQFPLGHVMAKHLHEGI